MDVNMILKQKDNKNKTTKIGLMGVCSNCHEHENNQDYNFF
jgi:cytochrome c553